MRLLNLAVLTGSLIALPASGQERDKWVVGVLRYENNTGDEHYEHLGRAFSSMMISDLSVIERIQLIERERIEDLVAELDLQQSAYVDPESAQSVGMIIGAEYLVTGAFITVDPEIRMDTRIARVETSEIVTAAEVTGQQETLFDLQQRLADQVIDGLELVLSADEERQLRVQQDANRIDDIGTMVAFSEALCLLDYGAYVEALDAMQGVQRAAPRSQIVNATLGALRDRAAEDGRNRLTNEANRRIGGLLGRNRNQAQARPRPAQC